MANDSAVRIAHHYFSRLGRPSKKKVISRINAYHGSTYLTMTLTGILEDHENFHKRLVDFVQEDATSTFDHPHSILMTPVFKEAQNDESGVVGMVAALLPIDRYLVDLLPEGVDGITCVVKNSCNQSFTYELDGNRVGQNFSSSTNQMKEES